MIKMGLLRLREVTKKKKKPSPPEKAGVLEGVEHAPDCRVLGEWNGRDVRFV